MEIIPFLIPLALILAIFFIAGFIWMTKDGQYDDLETPRHRMLLDDDLKKESSNNQTQEGDL